ncbi:hypothetical protein M441DRAFT_45279 [Trichoderma asperellum CBS 433.97]|uniref:Uncharacterized protein n=1 Tax=Trichoderma asperellum (strain ATCC 204424 / CBS 433.97 / NBRC 101777) TaxID=1042311 RepID=A0A2T3ZET4_TRIA4|nr:hypothetical protein M441DRAFT_45279 [Trichoderma asperellum CBS 433.97]PTB43321.1 hypothetical protein M441DRAFT_45279 [Trichoderma asperellum CBS 433.97]
MHGVMQAHGGKCMVFPYSAHMEQYGVHTGLACILYGMYGEHNVGRKRRILSCMYAQQLMSVTATLAYVLHTWLGRRRLLRTPRGVSKHRAQGTVSELVRGWASSGAEKSRARAQNPAVEGCRTGDDMEATGKEMRTGLRLGRFGGGDHDEDAC